MAFVINIILLFHRVNIIQPEGGGDDDGGAGDEGEEGEVDEVEPLEEIYIAGLVIPYVEYEFHGWMLDAVLYWLAMTHMVFSVLLAIAFVLSKVS